MRIKFIVLKNIGSFINQLSQQEATMKMAPNKMKKKGSMRRRTKKKRTRKRKAKAERQKK